MQSTLKTVAAPARLGATMMLVGAVLAGCGGGDDYDTGDLSGTLTITGTAATVAAGTETSAIGGAAVLATCARGQGTATTNADGSFSVTVANPGAAPCVLQVFRADNFTLRSVATGNGNFNITPVTELLVQYISSQISTTAVPVTPGTTNSPIPLTSNAAFARLMSSPDLLNRSIARVGEFARTVPAPASTLVVPGDFLTGKLVARTASSAGNEQNVFLEALRARDTITATGALNAATATAANADANLPANKVAAP
ncbi:hypothetical protein [Pseudoduganella lutea]|uniref:Carboxypeptidase regulatory-like domain-containing protein n=1 Tax=Pseudoduganella lutea TaxID=321985 RepID=A0A4V0Z315_9BURK|nr:hypothetical protein [Pseudoduganella lutea]QBE61863.1 hypothetical protein EWM63_01675 [Pseudoduganella lutea]